MEWSLQNQTSLIIGKSTDKEPVDIDLSGSAVAQMISKQHAVLNYTDKGWFIDDIDSKNGTRVKKASQNAIMDVKLVGAIEVERGDIIYIASTMLQIQ
jgi:pSer/pThr/pTyr-binding forkhead associated (FHA) protein